MDDFTKLPVGTRVIVKNRPIEGDYDSLNIEMAGHEAEIINSWYSTDAGTMYVVEFKGEHWGLWSADIERVVE